MTGNNNNPPKKNNTMKHEYTKLQAAIAEHKALTADYWAARWHDEVDARNRQYNELECTRAIAEKALTELAKTKENGLSQLRPLAEADDVPEGCVRVRAWEDINRWIYGWNEWDGDTHFADIRLPESAEKPKPETFEAHGKTWTKHKPGDAMPCDGSSAVMAMLGDGTFCTQQAEDWNWDNRDSTFDIVGWRYADKPTPEPLVTKPISLPLAEGMTLRDIFAGQALAGSLASQTPESYWAFVSSGSAANDSAKNGIAKLCYDLADAMLAAREVKP